MCPETIYQSLYLQSGSFRSGRLRATHRMPRGRWHFRQLDLNGESRPHCASNHFPNMTMTVIPAGLSADSAVDGQINQVTMRRATVAFGSVLAITTTPVRRGTNVAGMSANRSTKTSLWIAGPSMVMVTSWSLWMARTTGRPRWRCTERRRGLTVWALTFMSSLYPAVSVDELGLGAGNAEAGLAVAGEEGCGTGPTDGVDPQPHTAETVAATRTTRSADLRAVTLKEDCFEKTLELM